MKVAHGLLLLVALSGVITINACDPFKWCRKNAVKKVAIDLAHINTDIEDEKGDNEGERSITITLKDSTNNADIGQANATINAAHQAEITLIEIEPPYRNQKCGYHAISTLIDYLRNAKRCKEIIVKARPYTIPMNEKKKRKAALDRLIKFYTSLGFTFVSYKYQGEEALLKIDCMNDADDRKTTVDDSKLLPVVIAP